MQLIGLTLVLVGLAPFAALLGALPFPVRIHDAAWALAVALVVAGAALLRRARSSLTRELIGPGAQILLGCAMTITAFLPWNRMLGGRPGSEGELLDTMMILLVGLPGIAILVRGLRHPPRDRNWPGAPTTTETRDTPARAGSGLINRGVWLIVGPIALGLALIPFASTSDPSLAGYGIALMFLVGTVTVPLGIILLLIGALSGKGWAWFGAASGAALVLFSLLLLVDPFAAHFESGHAAALLQAMRGQERGWNHGNIVHHANLRLGHVALKQGRIEDAKRYLLEAGIAATQHVRSRLHARKRAPVAAREGNGDRVLEALRQFLGKWPGPAATLDRAHRGGRAPGFPRPPSAAPVGFAAAGAPTAAGSHTAAASTT